MIQVFIRTYSTKNRLQGESDQWLERSNWPPSRKTRVIWTWIWKPSLKTTCHLSFQGFLNILRMERADYIRLAVTLDIYYTYEEIYVYIHIYMYVYIYADGIVKSQERYPEKRFTDAQRELQTIHLLNVKRLNVKRPNTEWPTDRRETERQITERWIGHNAERLNVEKFHCFILVLW